MTSTNAGAPSHRLKLGHVIRILTLCLGGLAGFLRDQACAAETTPVVLQLVDQTDVSAAGAIVALKAGLFAKYGLSVRIENIDGGDASLQKGDAIVIRLQNAREFLIARAAGVPLVVIASNYIDSSVVFYFRRDRKIRSPDDLVAKKVGYDSKSDTGFVFEWFLGKNSVSRSSLTEVATSAGPSGILDNTLDVLVGHAGVENVAFERNGVDYDVLDPRQYGVHIPGTAYLTTEANIRQNPDAIIRFLQALIAGWDLVYIDLDRTASMLAPPGSRESEIGLLRRSLEQQREFLRPGGARFGEVLKHKWSEIYAYMFQKRLIRSPIDLSRATDQKLLTEAYRSGGRKIAK
ncbi:ABC transporter substrate-binding protein [Bradyrhizobium sp. 1]|uniref:ABC transporter substrate-binding protein n=1 Tax=Bradyrhizobium sp. 1 TaxID=241591 RepID=UPI001FF9CEE7|nr:ABC transporter substrate-binding protein [Bradyrhizobium sp. 1]MCK1396160.1 ABC transporter substrate-binding protein [Bradyrhizobium sp. 1]